MLRCAECGGGLFAGEWWCPRCGTPVPDDVDGPPPEGATLVVLSEMDKLPARNTDLEVAKFREATVVGRSASDDVDLVADLLRPERDRQGRILWDPKSALIGGVIVALVVAAGVGCLVWMLYPMVTR